MISSGFQEGSTRISTTSTASTRKWTRDELEETETENGGEQAFDDSDDETDLHFTGAGASPPASTSPSTPSHPFHQIIITQAAFTTFTAAICWLETGYIQFPPLSSTFPPLTRGADRLKLISAAAAAEPTLPILASPFSVYRLAHFLELPELQQIALDAIVANLTVENVAVTGFASDVALAYPEVQNAAVRFAKDNWGEVKGTEGMTEVRRRLERDELPGSVGALLYKLAVESGAGP